MITQKKILVISGDPILQGFIGDNLGERGHQVARWRENGDKVKAILNNVLPDLVILDIEMPRLDGVEMCLRIRQWSQAPIIMLSTWGAGKDKVRGLDLSSDDYLTEAFGAAELMARIEEVLYCN